MTKKHNLEGPADGLEVMDLARRFVQGFCDVDEQRAVWLRVTAMTPLEKFEFGMALQNIGASLSNEGSDLVGKTLAAAEGKGDEAWTPKIFQTDAELEAQRDAFLSGCGGSGHRRG